VSNVVSIADARPHLAGPALCLECRHEWVAVAPLGMTVMDCPSCGARKGARLAMVQKEGPHWECACGNGLFFIREGGTYCPNCGLEGPRIIEEGN
jgi:predicted RNA-binding Zn-ribbon protein involved in translation (DUF1610 family)